MLMPTVSYTLGMDSTTDSRRLIRVTTYLHADEAAAVEEAAHKRRVSRAAVIREAVREHLGIED